MVDTVRTLAALQALLADNTSGDISAQDMRDFLVSAYPNLPGARVYINAAQQIANNSVVQVSWDAIAFDDDSMVDLATQPTRVTIKTAGRYSIATAGSWPNAAGGRLLDIQHNGSAILARSEEEASASVNHAQTLYAGEVDLSVNDYLQTRVRQQSGGPLNLTAADLSAPGSVFLSVQMVRRP